jgi:hypothetical protein
MILKLSIESWYSLVLFLTLYLGEMLCLVCDGYETDAKMYDVYIFYSAYKVIPSGEMVFTC